MGEEALVEGRISDAFELVKRLDANGTSPTLAAWYLYDDVNEWRLILAGPGFDKLLPRQEPLAYRKIAEVLGQMNAQSLSISDVKLLTTKSVLPSTIRRLIGTPADALARAHFSSNYVDGTFIKEMIVLRSA